MSVGCTRAWRAYRGIHALIQSQMRVSHAMSYPKFRQPEYTGKNRCIPCTILNVAIAGSISLFLTLVSPLLSVTTFLLSLLTIYLRGYLVPGTPTFTKRYFPNRILQWFDKDSSSLPIDTDVNIDPEQVLLDARVVELCDNGTDLCLTSDFEKAWYRRMDSIDDPDQDRLTQALNLHHDQLSFEEHGDALVVHSDGEVIAQYDSTTAIIADVAAADELARRSQWWSGTNPAEKARVLTSLRVFIESCPMCGGYINIEQEIIEPCCRSYDVIAAACSNCGSQLFEIEWSDESL